MAGSSPTDRDAIRGIIVEVLKEMLEGTVVSEPECDCDGDEHNVQAFGGVQFVHRVFCQ